MSAYLVGIDLGTTNTVVAYAEAVDSNPEVQIFPLPQLVASGEVAALPLLPSACYLYADGELDAGDIGLPWQPGLAGNGGGDGIIVGQWARELGEKTPGRLVASAKSWLSHSRVDRNAAILPWGDVGNVRKISPVQASALFLKHVRSAWNHRFPRHPLERQVVVITVPASFDEGARALTLAAARQAGLDQLKLLEEPQAACYDWISSHGQLSAERRLLLVCDVGGGTTDLTLIRIDHQGNEVELTRIGVGNHLMLGGDNIDLALAHQLERQSGAERMNYSRLAQLLQQTRQAKEALLAEQAPDSRNVTVLAGGSKLLAGAKTIELQREQVRDLVLEGYFPRVGLEPLDRKKRSAVVEFGLPYESEGAITRHLADFILRHQQAMASALGQSIVPGQPLIPDCLLLNGGVFNAETVRQRVVSLLQQWRDGSLAELTGSDPNLAVARGAVFYSLAQRGHGHRIGGGSARSYYLKLKTRGKSSRYQLVCLLPKGAPFGKPVALPDREFGLVLGNPVRFDLCASTADVAHRPGDLVPETEDEDMLVLPPLATVLTGAGDQDGGKPGQSGEVRVQLQSELTEIGTLAVSCIDPQSGQQWLLDFQLRSVAPIATAAGDGTGPVAGQQVLPPAAEPAASRHPKLDQALSLLDRLYGKSTSKPDSRLIKTVRNDLEKMLGNRHEWDMALLRELADQLLRDQKQRRRSIAHERLWLNLAGLCLRPGYGSDLDQWRVQQVEKLYQQGVIHRDEAQVWAEWWTLWRRVAGGLSEAMQARLFKDIRYYLHPSVAQSRARTAELQRRAYSEMVRLLGSLEGLEPEQKQEAGGWLLRRLQKSSESEQTWWAIGRLGARVPFYGNAHKMLNAATAESWLQQLLQKDWQKERTAAFAATLIARHSGDRELDISNGCQLQVQEKLKTDKCPTSWLQLVSERVELDQADSKRVFGEALPQGIRLLR